MISFHIYPPKQIHPVRPQFLVRVLRMIDVSFLQDSNLITSILAVINLKGKLFSLSEKKVYYSHNSLHIN